MTSFATFCSDTARKFGQMLSDESGATAIEYAMIAAGIGTAIAATVYSLGTQVKQQLYDKIDAAFN